MSDAPIIRTDRLVLCAHAKRDFEAYQAFCASDRAAFFGGPMSQRDAWSMFCRGVAAWSLLGFGCWAIRRAEDDAYIGEVGLFGHPYFPEIELGWFVTADGEGVGFATEAVVSARLWAYGTRGLETLVSYIHRDNERSIALAERIGAAPDPNAPPPPYADHVVYRHPSPADLATANPVSVGGGDAQ